MLRRDAAFALLICVAVNPLATFAYDLRDVVFECPCSAVWIGDAEDPAGERGRLSLTFGVRSHRGADSSEFRLTPFDPDYGLSLFSIPYGERDASVNRILAGAILDGEQRTMTYDRPESGSPVGVALSERIGRSPSRQNRNFAVHELLTLWPVPGEGNAERVEYVDIFTDRDGDGIGDVNEGIADTAPDDPALTPGVSTIDVLAVYNAGYSERFRGDPLPSSSGRRAAGLISLQS